MIVVIADDLTGAAEIAGIAWRNGLLVRMIMRLTRTIPTCDVLVIATNTRQATKAKAIKETDDLMHKLSMLDSPLFFYKKTDSALRGHIVAELNAMMLALQKPKALLIAQNPSKERIIKNGIYYLDDLPLHQSQFYYDPEFPANTAVVEERLPGTHSLSLRDSLQKGINIADASSQEDIKLQLQKCSDDTILAGGADTFGHWIKMMTPDAKDVETTSEFIIPSSNVLLIQGSTQSHANNFGLPESLMPDDVFHGESPEKWIKSLKEQFNETSLMAIRIPQPSKGGKDYAIRLRNTMAKVTAKLVKEKAAAPFHLMIEGGATAYAIIQRLGWNSFSIERELAPGVVTIQYKQTLITLKPGSYPWPS